MRTDGVTSYVSLFQVYIGKEVLSETGLGARVIKDMTNTLRQTLSYLLQQLLQRCKLLQQLHRDGIYATGTIREDRRGFPSALDTCEEGIEGERRE